MSQETLVLLIHGLPGSKPERESPALLTISLGARRASGCHRNWIRFRFPGLVQVLPGFRLLFQTAN